MGLEIPLIGIVFIVLIFVALVATEYYSRKPAKHELSQDERRAFPRHKISVRIKYKTPASEGVTWIRDISESGARLFLNNKLKAIEVGEPLSIEISLPSENAPIAIDGNIVWSEGDDAGFRFQKIVEGNVEDMIQYVSERVGQTIPQEA